MDRNSNLDKNGIIRTDNYVFPCPVCDSPNQFFDIGSYECCGVCGWEDDEVQYDDHDETGANLMSLNDARSTWQNGGSIYPNHPNPKMMKEKAS